MTMLNAIHGEEEATKYARQRHSVLTATNLRVAARDWIAHHQHVFTVLKLRVSRLSGCYPKCAPHLPLQILPPRTRPTNDS